MNICFPLYTHERTLLATIGSSESCHERKCLLLGPLEQRLTLGSSATLPVNECLQ